ncbi:ribosome 60S biogenesis N-terminal-domain-containing protein [Favolaschia claudopus]|uniref:Ribosome 60S biogenesis N-terminal-domain-containing protein n=1 Tax=Favolaschia claudopus TaxID=2862362 RepID=A0AAW0DAN4_9AGAR
MPEPPPKRQKTGKPAGKFANSDEIRTALRSQNQEDISQALTDLRNQFSVWPNEGPISPQDTRLLLAQKWLDASPGAHDLFTIWENSNVRQPASITPILSLLASLLTLLSAHYTFHAAGHPILRTLLTPPWMKKLNSYLGGSHTELLLVTMKLFNSMSAYGGGRERKSILESFAWETKSLPKLLNMRRKSKTDDSADPLAKPDIRTLYILFCLSFVEQDNSTQLKTIFLEQHRDAFFSIFRGLAQDSYTVLRKILEICWTGIWLDPKIKRTLKIGLFSEITIAQLLKIYERASSEDGDSEHVPADLVHHFLLALCTRPGAGICFRDRGWYPRTSETDNAQGDDDDVLPSRDRGGKIHNKILGNVLKTLKVNEDLRQQELALKIMAACPELVAGYWSSAGLTLEPRLSSKWIANISFFGSVLSLRVPEESFLFDNASLYHPTPPPLAVILENILPSVNTKTHFSRGLQQPSGLVQHCTALALCKCLAKFGRVSRIFQAIEAALEENEGDGQWAKVRHDLEREIRRRVPEFQVILAFATVQKDGTGKAAPHPTKRALLAEAAQRLLWMYHLYLPNLVAETRFDIGKLVQNFVNFGKVEIGGLDTVRQLHVLRLLTGSDQFVWSGKGPSGKSHLHVFLGALCVCKHPALRQTLRTLIVHLLSESVIFQNHPEEPSLWLSALPAARNSPITVDQTSEEPSFHDEAAVLVAFIDDCVQRCLRTPYKYLEDMQVAGAQLSTPQDLPSSLIMAVLEQLAAKEPNMSPSDAFTLTQFLRRLVLKLSRVQRDLSFLRHVAGKVEAIMQSATVSKHPAIFSALRREIDIIHGCLPCTHSSPAPPLAVPYSSELVECLDRIGVQSTADDATRILSAFEVVDRVRLAASYSLEQIRTCAATITRLHVPALHYLADSIDPRLKNLWDGLNVKETYPTIRPALKFDTLFFNSTVENINDEASGQILAEAAVTGTSTSADVNGAMFLVNHSLSASASQELTGGLVRLMAAICERSAPILPSEDYAKLNEEMFTRYTALIGLCTSSDPPDLVLDELSLLVKSVFPHVGSRERDLVSNITKHWLNVLTNGVSSSCRVVSPWIRFMEPHDLLSLLQLFDQGQQADIDLLKLLVAGLENIVKTHSAVDWHKHLPLLVKLRSTLPGSTSLENVIATIVIACVPVGLSGRAPSHSTGSASLIERCDTAWTSRSHLITTLLDVQLLLFQDEVWSDSAVDIIIGVLYQSGCEPDTFLSWLASDSASSRSVAHLSQVLHAYADSSDFRSDPQAKPAIWMPHLSRMLESLADAHVSTLTRANCSACICLVLARIPNSIPEFVVPLQERIKRLAIPSLDEYILSVGLWLAKNSAEGKDAVASLIDHGMQWCIHAFSTSDAGAEVAEWVHLVDCLMGITHVAKAHIAETLLSVIIQSRLTDASAVALLSTILRTVTLKPLIVNRYIQTIIQHPQFYKASRENASRDRIIQALHILFNLHPANTCQVTHIQPLVRIYRGTASAPDRKLLSIFQLFESQRKISVASLIRQWSATPETTSSTILDAVQSLDATLVLRTCLHFPKGRCLADQIDYVENLRDAQLYDPVFLILIFALTMAEESPESAFHWIELFRTNIVSLLIRTLSAKDQLLREVARSQLAALWAHMETADMQEQSHVVYVLNVLRNLLPQPSSQPTPRLPSYTTLILMHALRGIFYPSNFIYPLTARFLLQRPTLDVSDVPMLYGMLYSGSDDWKKERGWIIRFISDGMMSTDDWRVLKRRHTWELLSGLYQSSERDTTLRYSVLEVLANLTCNVQATTSLILKSSLLHWIEMQLRVSTTEAVEWVRIIDNILTIVDAQRIESSTAGDWRSIICRCLVLIMRSISRSSKPEGAFASATPVVWRLCALPGPSPHALPDLLGHSLNSLKLLEPQFVLALSRTFSMRDVPLPSLPPHNGAELHLIGDYNPLFTWGNSVEYLWQASMTLSDRSTVWDVLTYRLLLWRSIVGENASPTGELARKLAVRNLHRGHTSP